MPAMSHTLVPSCACPSPSLRAKDALVSARQAARFAHTRNSSTPRVGAVARLDCIASQGDLARVRRGAAAQQVRRNFPIHATAAGARETRQPKSSALATPPASNTIYPRAQPPADQKAASTRRRLRIAVDVDEGKQLCPTRPPHPTGSSPTRATNNTIPLVLYHSPSISCGCYRFTDYISFSLRSRFGITFACSCGCRPFVSGYATRVLLLRIRESPLTATAGYFCCACPLQ